MLKRSSTATLFVIAGLFAVTLMLGSSVASAQSDPTRGEGVLFPERECPGEGCYCIEKGEYTLCTYDLGHVVLIWETQVFDRDGQLVNVCKSRDYDRDAASSSCLASVARRQELFEDYPVNIEELIQGESDSDDSEPARKCRELAEEQGGGDGESGARTGGPALAEEPDPGGDARLA